MWFGRYLREQSISPYSFRPFLGQVTLVTGSYLYNSKYCKGTKKGLQSSPLQVPSTSISSGAQIPGLTLAISVPWKKQNTALVYVM